VREDVQVRNRGLHLETVVQDDVPTPQPKDYLLGGGALGVVATVGIILVTHYGVNNKSRKG
jgi:CHASE1-domain containing sensor protein